MPKYPKIQISLTDCIAHYCTLSMFNAGLDADQRHCFLKAFDAAASLEDKINLCKEWVEVK